MSFHNQTGKREGHCYRRVSQATLPLFLLVLLAFPLNAAPSFIVKPNTVPVAEGGEQDVMIALSEAPSKDVSATLARVAGDADISVATGTAILIPKADWQTGVPITLAANEDADERCSRSDFTITNTTTGITIAVKRFTAFEIDNDGETVVGGVLGGDTVWNDTGRKYLLTSTVTVPATATLTIGAGVVVVHEGYFHGFVVNGTMEAEASSILLMRTHAHWDSNSIRNGITLAGGSAGLFDRCAILSREYSDRWAQGANEWGTLVKVDAKARISLAGCALESVNTVNGYRTGYGVLIPGATTEIVSSAGAKTSVRGFRHGLHQAFSSSPQHVAPSIFENCSEMDYTIAGNVVRDVTLENTGMRVAGTITVTPKGTLRLAEGSNLYQAHPAALIVDGGKFYATDAEYTAETYKYPSGYNERRHGIVFTKGGKGFFVRCSLKADERRIEPNWDWMTALIHADATATLSLKGCSLESLNIDNRRAGYGIQIVGATATIMDDVARPMTIKGFYTGIGQTFGQGRQSIAPCAITGCDADHRVNGIVARDTTLENRNMWTTGSVTVQPGVTLTLAPGSGLKKWYPDNLTIDAGKLVVTDATLTAETYKYPPGYGERRHGLVLQNGAKGLFRRSVLNADEKRSEPNFDWWTALVYADSASVVSVTGCSVISRNPNGWRTGYGIYVDGGTASITADGARRTTFKGFYTGYGVRYGTNTIRIDDCDFDSVDYEGGIQGNVTKPAAVSANRNTLFGALTVKSGGTLNFQTGSELNTLGNTLAIDTGGKINTINSSFVIDRPVQNAGIISSTATVYDIRTQAWWDASQRYCGFSLNNGSKSVFHQCSFYGLESRTSGSDSEWSAMIYIGADASLRADNCFFKTRTDNGFTTRYAIRSWSQKTLSLTGCAFIDNYIGLKLDALPSVAQVLGNDFAGNILYAVQNGTGSTLMARGNWWGSASGPEHVENPGGTGDRVSDYVDYGQSTLAANRPAIVIMDPMTGQETSNLTLAATQANVELVGFRVEPGQSKINHLRFGLHSPNGLAWTQFSNFRLALDQNGNGKADAGELAAAAKAFETRSTASRLTIDFNNVLTTPASSSAGYILVGAVGGVEAGDAFTAEVDPSFGTWSNAGVAVQFLTHSVRHVAGGSIFLANAVTGQVGDNLGGGSKQNNVALYAFRLLGNTAEKTAVTRFSLSNIAGLTRASITSTALYMDANGDSRWDAADTRLGSATEVVVAGSAGSMTFGDAMSTNKTYFLVASFRGLRSGASLTVALTPDNIKMSALTAVQGSADSASHFMDPPYMISENENWTRPAHFGQTTNQTAFPFLGIRVLPLGRTVESLTVQLSSVVGINAPNITNARLYWDKNDDGVLDGGDEVFAQGVVSLTGQEGAITFETDFISRGSLLLVADFASLANGDEFTVNISSADMTVPSGYGVTGAVPPIRYYARSGMPDNNSKNMNWALTYRSPGGVTVMGHYNNGGDKVILGYDTGSAWIYDSTTNTPVLMLKDHYDKVEYAGFSSDDSAAITVSRDGAVFLWDVKTGAQRSAMFSDLLVSYAVPSPDLRKLMVITEGKGILLDVENQQRLWEYVPGNATVNAIAYSPDGKYILIGSSDKRAYLLNAANGVEVRRYIGHTQAVTAVAFTGDGSHLMTSSTDAVVNYWITNNGLPLGSVISSISLQGQQSQGAAVSLDGTRVAVVTGTGNSAQLRMFDPTVGGTMLELYGINLYDESGGRWGGNLENLTFDPAGKRILVTSRDSDWARVASFRVDNGGYLLSWGPEGRFAGGTDVRPRISEDGERIFFMGSWGLNTLFRTPGKLMLTAGNVPGDKGFDITSDGSRVAWFTNQGNLRIDNVSEQGYTPFLDRYVNAEYYNALTYSNSGDMIIAGDRLFNGRTGALVANYAMTDRNARGAFSPDVLLWGFAVPQDHAMVTCRTNDPANPQPSLYNMMLTDPYAAYKMFYHPDGKRVACVDGNTGVQMYDMTTDLPVGLYRFSNNQDAALSKDGTLMLIAGRNEVHLREVKTGRNLRFFYPQHSGLQNVDVRAVQFADNDNLIMIAWSYNYIETYERSKPIDLQIYPASRVLAASESQSFRVTVVYDGNTTADVSPSSATSAENAVLEIFPPSAATVDANTVTVNKNATGAIKVRARYREGSTSFVADAVITVGKNKLLELTASPGVMSLVPGVFRDIAYRARYDDGYETDVTSKVALSTSNPDDVTIAGQSIRINMTAPPNVFRITGVYTDAGGNTASATTAVESFGLKTHWERYRMTAGGYGLSGDWSPKMDKLAWGSSSGGVCIYDVGATPSQYALDRVLIAHDSAIVFVNYISDSGLLTVSRDGTIKTWDLVASPTEPLTAYHHAAPIMAAARSGAKVVFGDNLGQVGVYDYSLNEIDWIHGMHNGAVRAVAIDADYVLSGGADWRVKVLQRADGSVLRAILSHDAPIVSVGFLGTQSFFSVSEDRTASFWRRSNFDIIQRYEYPVTPSAAEVVGGNLYVGTTNPNATWIYNSDGLLLRWLDHPPNRGSISKYLVDPSNTYVLTGRNTIMVDEPASGLLGQLGETERKPSPFASVQFWEKGRGIFRGSLAHSFPLTDAHVASNTRQIFTQSAKRTIKWNFDIKDVTATESHLMETGFYVDRDFAGMDFSSGENILATRVDVSVYLFNTLQNTLWRTLHMPGPGAGPFSISPSGNRMAFSDSKTRLWDLNGMSQIAQEDRVATALDFRLENDFLGGVNSRIIGVWHAAGSNAGLMYNAMQTEFTPARIFVNTTGSRCAAVTYEVECDSLGDCTWFYYLEIFDISDVGNLTVEPPKIGASIFLFSAKEDIFAGGQSSYVAITDDTTLAVVGADGDRPVRLISTADGTVIREFDAPSGHGETSLGSASVGFADNDRTLMIGWKEGFAELWRRIPPWKLSVLVTKNTSAKTSDSLPLAARQTLVVEAGDVYVKPGESLNTETFAIYKDGSELNVTSTAGMVSDNPAVAAVVGRWIHVSQNAKNGQRARLTVSYDELGNTLEAIINVIVGLTPSSLGDTNEDGTVSYLDLFEFSQSWNSPDDGTNTRCDEVDDDQIDEKDLMGLMKYWKD